MGGSGRTVFGVGSSAAVVMVWAAVWLAVLAVVAETAMGGTVTAEQPFNVKPNGRLEFVAVEVGGGTGLACVFEYAAGGGTNEEWISTKI